LRRNGPELAVSLSASVEAPTPTTRRAPQDSTAPLGAIRHCAANLIKSGLLASVFALMAGCLVGGAWAEDAAPKSKDVEPPIIKLPLDVVEPRRDVAAATWKSPYCGRWFDGCTECSRNSARAEPRCGPRQGMEVTKCVRHSVLCLAPMSIEALTSVCTAYDIEDYFFDYQGNIIARSETEYTDDCQREFVSGRLLCKDVIQDYRIIFPFGYKYWQFVELEKVLIFPLLIPGLPLIAYKTMSVDRKTIFVLESLSKIPLLRTQYLPGEYGYTCINVNPEVRANGKF
jgi:hypothetical protein